MHERVAFRAFDIRGRLERGTVIDPICGRGRGFPSRVLRGIKELHNRRLVVPWLFLRRAPPGSSARPLETRKVGSWTPLRDLFRACTGLVLGFYCCLKL